MEQSSINIFKQCFKALSVEDLNNRINEYRDLVQRESITEKTLRDSLRMLTSVKIDGKLFSFFINEDTITEPNQIQHFYRIRKFEKDDYLNIESKLFPSMRVEQDAWCKPHNLVLNYGRLNRPGETVLYSSSETLNAIYETNCLVNQFFFLIVYEKKQPLRVSQIHQIKYLDSLSELDNAKRLLIHNFLLSEFTKHVPVGQEHIYKSSLLIYEEFFKNSDNSGFVYPSIATPQNRGFNICFESSKAKENLELKVVMICKLAKPKNEQSEFTTEIFYDGFLNESDQFEFHPVNSHESRERLGNFFIKRSMGL